MKKTTPNKDSIWDSFAKFTVMPVLPNAIGENIWHNILTLEELYQMFKNRFIDECLSTISQDKPKTLRNILEGVRTE